MTWRFIRRKWDLIIEDNVKRSIEQDIRNNNFAPEMEIMKETPWSGIQGTKQRVQRNLGDC